MKWMICTQICHLLCADPHSSIYATVTITSKGSDQSQPRFATCVAQSATTNNIFTITACFRGLIMIKRLSVNRMKTLLKGLNINLTLKTTSKSHRCPFAYYAGRVPMCRLPGGRDLFYIGVILGSLFSERL